MKYLLLFIMLLPAFIQTMDVTGHQYPPNVTTINQKLIHDAFLGDRNLGHIRQLIKSGADVNSLDAQGRTPLSMASYGAQLGTIEILLAHGANPNLASNEGSTPLTNALAAYTIFPVENDWRFQRRVIGSIARLIRAGANVNSHQVQKYINNHPELMRVLKHAQEIAQETGPQKLL